MTTKTIKVKLKKRNWNSKKYVNGSHLYKHLKKSTKDFLIKTLMKIESIKVTPTTNKSSLIKL